MKRPAGHQAPISFRSVNRPDAPGYDPGLQRHHLLPCEVVSRRCFGPMFESLGLDRIGFADFRCNGLLLPACDTAALRMGLPLHRGPHRGYNALVMERVGQVEAGWSADRRCATSAGEDAMMRLALLQRALRRRLLDASRTPLSLNRKDPLGQAIDFTALDEMADALWPATDWAQARDQSSVRAA